MLVGAHLHMVRAQFFGAGGGVFGLPANNSRTSAFLLTEPQ